MKKIVLLVSVLGLCLMAAACGGTISKSKAIDAALKELGLNITTTPREDAELISSANPPAYKVTVYLPEENKIVMVDAKTAKVLSVETEDANRP